MDKQTKWILGSVGALGCLGVIGGIILVIYTSVLLTANAFTQSEVAVETSNPDDAQVAHCRETMEIRASATIKVEWYYFQPGFQDDRLQCHFTATASSADAIFNDIIDTHVDDDQNLYPGRYIKLNITDNGDGTFWIEAFYYEI